MDQDDELDLEETAGEPEEDLLAGLDDATRTAVEARIAAQVAAAAEAEKARLGEEFKQHQAGYTKRLSTGNRQLEERFGLSLDADGNPVFKDPAKFGQAALGLVGAAGPAKVAPDELDAPIDYTEEPAVLQAKIDRQIERRSAEALKAAMGPIETQLAEMRALMGVASQPALNSVPDTARDLLDELGVGSLADHQDFATALRDAVQKNLQPGQWHDPMALQSVALMVGGQLAREAPDRKTQRSTETVEARNANLYRASVGATGASRGGGRAPTADQQARAEYEQFKKDFPEQAHTSFERFRLMENEDANYGHFQAAGRKRGQ
jgi:hypothetical protein